MFNLKIAKQNVTLVDHMGSDLSIVNAARVSFDKESGLCAYEKTNENGITEIRLGLSDADEKLIGYLAKHNHWSPFAHTSIQLRVKAPIFVARQLVKHQIGGVWNEVSRRYVDNEPEFFFPEVWRGRPQGSIKQGSSGEVILNVDEFAPDVDTPLAICHEAAKTYSRMLSVGVAPEQARMILPQNMMTEWYWTGSLMFFCRVCRERLAPGAQQETREVAEMIAEIVAPLFPVGWSALMHGS